MSRWLRPAVEDLRVDFRLLTDFDWLSPDQFHAYMQICRLDALARVWTYDEPREEGGLREDGYRIHAVMGCRSRKVWQKLLSSLIELRVVYAKDGYIFPVRRDIIIVQNGRGDERPPIPASLRSHVMQRDGWRCSYCGTAEGPFDIDHVVPFSRGGAHTDPDNLVCACGPCNRAKRAMTPEEWLSAGPASVRRDP